MAANCAGIIGAQLFRSDDRPYYDRGWSIITGLMSFTLALVILLLALYRHSNRKMQKAGATRQEEAMEGSKDTEVGGQHVRVARQKPYNY